MELLNGTENRIRGLDKNVWGYCINMFSGLSQFFKSKTDINMENLNNYKVECEKAFNSLKTINMKLDDLNDINDIKLKIINFKTNYDNFIKVYQNAKNENKGSLYDEVNNLKDSFDQLEEKFIIRYLNHLAPNLNGTVQITNNLKKDFIYYTFGENYELEKLGVFVSKTNNDSNDKYVVNYNNFKLLDKENKKQIDYNDSHKYYIEVNPEHITKETPGGKPRRTRRHKNKKRRSSKQRISKK